MQPHPFLILHSTYSFSIIILHYRSGYVQLVHQNLDLPLFYIFLLAFLMAEETDEDNDNYEANPN